MPLDWTCSGLAKGLKCYQSEEFFEAHEHWEAVWLESPEPEKTFLQALIQITAAFHHLRRGNLAGTTSLLNAAQSKLERYPADYEGVPVEVLRGNLREWLQLLEERSETSRVAFPQIRQSVLEQPLD